MRKAIKFYFDNNEKWSKSHKCLADGAIISSIVLQAAHEKNNEAIDKIKEGNRKIYGIEQEASGIGWVSLKSHIKIEWADIRVVMDFCDPETRRDDKKDENKRKAAELSAKFSFEFLITFLYSSVDPSDENLHNRIYGYLNNLRETILFYKKGEYIDQKGRRLSSISEIAALTHLASRRVTFCEDSILDNDIRKRDFFL